MADHDGRDRPYTATALLSDRANGQTTYRTIVLPALQRIDAIVATLMSDPSNQSSWTITRALFGANLLFGLQSYLQPEQGSTTETVSRQVSDILVNGLSPD